MTREQYGQAYQKGFNLTVRFLVSRGFAYDSAQETAQAAWVKGWERLSQLRDPSMVLTWMNSIALEHPSQLYPPRAASANASGIIDLAEDQLGRDRRSPDSQVLQTQ